MGGGLFLIKGAVSAKTVLVYHFYQQSGNNKEAANLGTLLLISAEV